MRARIGEGQLRLRGEAVLGTTSIESDAAACIETCCARQVPAEVLIETEGGETFSARARLLGIEQDQVLIDAPAFVDDDRVEMVPGRPITLHFRFRGARLQFESVVLDANRRVYVGRRQSVPGMAIRLPESVTESQRRSHLRISMVGYDPVVVSMVAPEGAEKLACDIEADVLCGWMVDLSVGGVSLLLDSRTCPGIRERESYFLTFTLPGEEEPLPMFGEVRHVRVVEGSDSVRIALRFRDWCGKRLIQDQQRISRFVAEHQRRMLRRGR